MFYLKFLIGYSANLTKYLKHFNSTIPYYSFNYQNAHFLAMSTSKNKAIPYLPG